MGKVSTWSKPEVKNEKEEKQKELQEKEVKDSLASIGKDKIKGLINGN